ncbi:hypothetical protein B566_EDAN004614 [Ephemera danica]|nr:hypothetical protein B566_EDAN004614 [Ephemera danica]
MANKPTDCPSISSLHSKVTTVVDDDKRTANSTCDNNKPQLINVANSGAKELSRGWKLDFNLPGMSHTVDNGPHITPGQGEGRDTYIIDPLLPHNGFQNFAGELLFHVLVDRWYRGFCTKNRTLKGIFPVSFIFLKPCRVDNEGVFEVAILLT